MKKIIKFEAKEKTLENINIALKFLGNDSFTNSEKQLFIKEDENCLYDDGLEVISIKSTGVIASVTKIVPFLTISSLNNDYMYCNDEDSCIHRRGCKRWVGNYSNKAVKEFYEENRSTNDIDVGYCMDSVPYPFDSLDRFRNSDGSESK